MTTFVALLRAVNLGSKGIIAMAELRAIAEKLGLNNIRTLLQSGNLLFESKDMATSLEKKLEQATENRFNYQVPIVVRTEGEWRKIVNSNPFPQEAQADPGHLVLFSFKEVFTAEALKLLRESYSGPEYFEARGSSLYIVYPEDIGHSKFTGAMIERKLGVRGTARNWNTVRKIEAALSTAK